MLTGSIFSGKMSKDEMKFEFYCRGGGLDFSLPSDDEDIMLSAHQPR